MEDVIFSALVKNEKEQTKRIRISIFLYAVYIPVKVMAFVKEIVGTVIVLCILVIALSCGVNPKWQYTTYKAFHEMKKLFGSPSYLDSRPGGFALWSFRAEDDAVTGTAASTVPFARVVVQDRLVPHDDPVPHYDYIYTTILYSLDSGDRERVMKSSDALEYDGSRNELTARCSSLENTIALLVYADKVARNVISYSDVLEGKKFENCLAVAGNRIESNYNQLQHMRDTYNLRHPAVQV